MRIDKLKWDSEFFGIPIGRLDISGNEMIDETKLSGYDLIYLFVDPSDDEGNRVAVSLAGKCISNKIIYAKECKIVENNSVNKTNIIAFEPSLKKHIDDLIRIGIQSGTFSRFKIDPHFKSGSFERLYETWINRSLNHEIANEVFMAMSNEQEMQGLITVAKKGAGAEIGILVVDEKFRGNNVGMQLLRKTEEYCLQNGIKQLKVATQGSNKQACGFYEKNGFAIDNSFNIYHYWKGKNDNARAHQTDHQSN